MFAGWLRIGAMLFLHECFYSDDVCIECGICFYNRYWYFRFGDLQYTVYAPLLRQVYKGIILCMIPSLDFYFLALMIYSVGWILFICVKTKWKWQSLQLCLHLHNICIVVCPTEVGTLRPSMMGQVPTLWATAQVGVSGCRRVFTQAIPVYAKKSKEKTCMHTWAFLHYDKC
jgi:ferredoxin